MYVLTYELFLEINFDALFNHAAAKTITDTVFSL